MLMKPLRIFSHVACESPGYLATFLELQGFPFEVICLDKGVPVPQDLDDVAGLVILGGPGDVNKPTDWMKGEMELIGRAIKQDLPVLGICLGAQMLSKVLGGVVTPNKTLEVGWHPVINASTKGWFADLPAAFEVFQWHAHTFSLPKGAVALAHSTCAELQAFAFNNNLAMQFHLEMTPESIAYLIQQYASDLEEASSCVQDADIITSDLETRTRNLYQIADVVYGRWLECIYNS
ncbi:MAG TPA: type 1 glutamine amidotransferase [Chromatiales bacterium]|nr:type 1 glutamine amidotransferase [Thiotrichales bacterium]HIP67365.1 type 1 glutamine amidotransferase [Chromatiales bacterium]